MNWYDFPAFDSSSLATSVGICLIDRDRAVVAANAVSRGWLCESSGLGGAATPLGSFLAAPQVSSALARIFAGEEFLSVRAEWPGHALGTTPALVHLHRVYGPAGPQAVAVVHLAPHAALSTDALTDLPDRRALAARVAEWLRDFAQNKFALLFVDLDDFKRVNDQFGHAAGDLVLRELSARWLRCVREGDLVARYGGDEFVILLKHISQPAEAAPVLERLHDVTEGAIDLGDLPLRITCTIGVALSQRDGAGFDDLIAAADRDMYARKRASRPTARQ